MQLLLHANLMQQRWCVAAEWTCRVTLAAWCRHLSKLFQAAFRDLAGACKEMHSKLHCQALVQVVCER